MKRVLLIVMMAFMVLAMAGCKGAKTNPVEIRGQNDSEIAKVIDAGVANGFETMGNEDCQWFTVGPDQIMEQLNKKAAEKGYSALDLLGGSRVRNQYTFDNQSSYIGFDKIDIGEEMSAAGYVQEITISLYADDEERAKRNGEYVYFLIGLFNPGMEKVVSDELYIFDEAPADTPQIRHLVCGNVDYTYDEGGPSSASLSIKAARNPEWDKEEEKTAGAIRPE